MAVCRIKNPEQLKNSPPGELGKLLGLDRVPEVGHFRKKLKQVIGQGRTDEFHKRLFSSWITQMPEMFFYIDGHVRVYHGQKAKKANLTKRFVSREKLCLSGTTEYDQSGMPLMVVTGELNEKLKEAIVIIIEKLKKETPAPADKNHRVAIISYRKNVKDKWDDYAFITTVTQMFNNNVTMQLCEMGTLLNGGWFREIRKLSENGHQTSIITTHPTLVMPLIAGKMFSRWTQENFFKYMLENFEFDRMIEYGTELKKIREKKSRLEAKVFQRMESENEKTIEEVKKDIINTSDLIEKINAFNTEIDVLLKERSKKPSRISLSEMPQEQRYNKLKEESKKYKNAILMLAYRAETALFNIIITKRNIFKRCRYDP